MKKDINKAYVALALVSFLWGTTYIASRIGVQQMPGLFMAGLRQFVAGFVLVGYFMLKGQPLPEWKTFRIIGVQSIFLLCISNGLLTWSLEYISSGLAAIIAGLVPLFVAVFSVLLIRCAKVTKWMAVGLLAGLAGIITIFYDYINQLMNPLFAFGVALSLIATISWSYGSVYSSRNKISFDILYAVGLQMLTAGIIMLVVSFASGKYVQPHEIGMQSIYALLYLIVFGSLIAYSAYVFAISRLPATLVSIYAYINPVVALLLGWWLLSEKLNTAMVTGALITLAGVYLVNREFKKQRSAV